MSADIMLGLQHSYYSLDRSRATVSTVVEGITDIYSCHLLRFVDSKKESPQNLFIHYTFSHLLTWLSIHHKNLKIANIGDRLFDQNVIKLKQYYILEEVLIKKINLKYFKYFVAFYL